MDIKARYIVELTARENTAEMAENVAAVMAGDPELVENSKLRNSNLKFEKWWSVIAGILLVAAFILYSFYLTIPAVILLGLLIAFLIYAGINLQLQRKKRENAPHEISPRRSTDAFIKTALNLHISGRDVTGYLDTADIAEFGRKLTPVIAGVAAAESVPAAPVTTAVSVKVTDTEPVNDCLNLIPTDIIITIADTVELVLSYKAPFAIAITGDCALVDTCPSLGEAIKTDLPRKGRR